MSPLRLPFRHSGPPVTSPRRRGGTTLRRGGRGAQRPVPELPCSHQHGFPRHRSFSRGRRLSSPERIPLLPAEAGAPVAPAPIPSDQAVVRIRPPSGWPSLRLREVWEYRELLYFLIWRDIKVRYKQTALGAAWAVIQPFFTMVVFSVFFGRLARIPSEGVPYPLFAYCALVPWAYFANALTTGSNSLVDHGRLISKVYFPRLMVPAASVVAGLLDLAISFTVLLGMLVVYGITPGPAALTLPLFVLLATLTAFAVSLWLSALNVQYRDIRYTLPFLVQFWLFATPVAYPSTLVDERWRALYGLNPMAGVVEGFRWALLGRPAAPGPMILVSTATVIAVLVGGLYYFRRMEKTFADVV
ncbi:MAG TPA: ABC transporter permease [Gemmatimonadales bacterium]|nr:ABC transporter permease [Gemmatimonadales bacterium]